MSEQPFPAGQNQGLPQSSYPPVAVLERMDELELVVEDGAGDQRMLVRAVQPREQVGHEFRDAPRRRPDVVNRASSGDGDVRTAIRSGRIQQSFHQNPVGAQKVVLVAGIPFPVVGSYRVADFLNVFERSGDGFAVENRRDLLLAEDIAFDGQRTADRANSIASPRVQVLRNPCGFRPPDRFADLLDS